jgi:hypothetical protein
LPCRRRVCRRAGSKGCGPARSCPHGRGTHPSSIAEQGLFPQPRIRIGELPAVAMLAISRRHRRCPTNQADQLEYARRALVCRKKISPSGGQASNAAWRRRCMSVASHRVLFKLCHRLFCRITRLVGDLDGMGESCAAAQASIVLCRCRGESPRSSNKDNGKERCHGKSIPQSIHQRRPSRRRPPLLAGAAIADRREGICKASPDGPVRLGPSGVLPTFHDRRPSCTMGWMTIL